MKKIKLILVIGLCLGIVGCFSSKNLSIQNQSKTILSVNYLDVGQGDSILIRTKKHVLLIDGGEKDANVATKLRRYGVHKIDLMISTHAHSDHIGGLLDVLKKFPVSEVIDTGKPDTSEIYEAYLQYILENNILYTKGRTSLARVIDDVKMTVINPSDPLPENSNESSIVLYFIAGKITYLFMGDADFRSEDKIMKQFPMLSAMILKVGHHGSNSSTGMKFLKQIMPSIAVISVGRDNPYGHPAEATLDRLKKIGAEIYRTDQSGTIMIDTDGLNYFIQAEKKG